MKRTALPRLLVIVTLAVFVLPAAAAHDGCPDHPALVDHYLLKDADGDLRMSYMAPSAANASTWEVIVQAGKSAVVDLEFPVLAFAVDESIDLSGRLKLGVHSRDADGPPLYNPFDYDYPVVRVQLVEGERSVNIGQAYYGAEIELKGSYPGHGKDGAPHTHGAGNDASRGLHTSDLAVRLTFTVEESSFPVDALPNHSEWAFAVYIDGKSFLRLAKAGELPADAAPAPAPEPKAPAPSNETSNATGAPDQAPPETPDDGDQTTQSAWSNPVGATGGLALAGLFAGSGVAVLGWRRMRGR